MTFGHLLNTANERDRLYQNLSGYQDMASRFIRIEPLLRSCPSVLSAAPQRNCFRGMIYRRAKDFWEPAGASHGIMSAVRHITAMPTQFVYAAVVSVLLILFMSGAEHLLPGSCACAENIWDFTGASSYPG